MRFFKISFLFYFVLLSFSSLGIQPKDIRMERLTLKEGLRSYEIWALCQDRFGYLWIGSSAGLQKFDGLHFTNYNYQSTDSTSISSDHINCIMEDSKGRLWIGTEGGGLNYLLREKNIFIRYNQYERESDWGLKIKSIAEDQHGNIWFGTLGGIYKLNPETQKFVSYYSDSAVHGTINSRNVFTLEFDKKTNSLYAGTENGLNIYDEANDNFISHKNPDPLFPECRLLGGTSITNIFFEDTAFWISTIKGDLFYYNRISHELKIMNDFFKFKSNKTYEIYHFTRDSKGNLWVSSYYEGIRLLNYQNGKSEILQADSKQENGLASNGAIYLLKDKNETLWICTNKGVNYFNLKRQFFDQIDILKPHSSGESSYLYNIAADNKDRIWIGTRGAGLFCYHIKSQSTELILDAADKKMHVKDIWSVLVSKSGTVWAGTNSGLIKINPDKKIFSRFVPEYLDRDGRKLNDVIGICEDSNNMLWIVTWGGPVLLFNPVSESFAPADQTEGMAQLKNLRSVNIIFEDSKKRIWIGTDRKGLICWNRINQEFHYYNHKDSDPLSISSDQVLSIYESSDHSIWIGTINNYLNKFDEKHDNFIRFGQKAGITDALIQSIIEEKGGNIWLGTSNGLFQFNYKDSIVRTFDVFDGLPENIIYGNLIYSRSLNKIIFPSTSSLVTFNPENLNDQQFYSQVFISNIRLYDKLLANVESLGNSAQINLRPQDNFVSIEFNAIEFLHPGKVKYFYKLTGFNSDWVDNGDKRSVSFSNLTGGNYTLMVKCINADGVWSRPAMLTITKHPHLMETPWFRLFAAFLVASLIVGYIRFRVTGLRKQKIQLENVVELRTKQYKAETERAERSEKFKEEFLANMSHEIRTPMNAVVGLSNLLLATNLNEKQKHYMDAIRESSGNLMVILNDILDLSKIEAGKIEFEQIEFRVRKVVKNVEDILRLKAEEKSLFLKSIIQPEIPDLLLGDPTRLNQVLTNLTGNAIKFTEKGGVTISVERKAQTGENIRLVFKIIDTGIGIPVDRQGKIFESFEQAAADTTRKFGGTGLGLSISKKLVELQGGKIEVKSTPGIGSEFSFDMLYQLLVQEPEKIKESELQINPSEFNGIKVLIVEDNEFNQMVAVDTLLAFNEKINVDVAESGNAALNILKDKKYDVILMDIQMPEMNGYEVTGYIRNSANGLNKFTPIIAMTANASKAEIEKCFAASMNEYVSKPFEPGNLFQKIFKVLK